MELIKDYECTIHHHPCKANVVVDALSRKSLRRLSCVYCTRVDAFVELRLMGVEMELTDSGVLLAHFQVRPLLVDRMREMQS